MGRRGHRGRHGHRGSAPSSVAPERATERGPGRPPGLAPGDASSNGTGAASDGRSADVRPGVETFTAAAVRTDPAPTVQPTVEPPPREASPDGGQRNGATLPQLRRFIKSRPYIPMHELRRRFALACEADDVHPIDAGSCRLYVGLPEREAGFLGELIRSGEIGYELLLDPCSPLVIGVYAMRPVGRA